MRERERERERERGFVDCIPTRPFYHYRNGITFHSLLCDVALQELISYGNLLRINSHKEVLHSRLEL